MAAAAFQQLASSNAHVQAAPCVCGRDEETMKEREQVENDLPVGGREGKRGEMVGETKLNQKRETMGASGHTDALPPATLTPPVGWRGAG